MAPALSKDLRDQVVECPRTLVKGGNRFFIYVRVQKCFSNACIAKTEKRLDKR